MIHLTNVERGIIYDILSQYDGEVFAFGSRVKGTHHQFSDLDICYMKKIPNNVLSKINEDFEESNLKFKIDFVNFNLCDSDFKKLIQSDMVQLPSVKIKKPKTDEEWNKYHQIRIEEIFKDYPDIQYDKNHPSLSDKKHNHFILVIDEQIVGILQLELRPDNSCILRMIAIAQNKQHNGFSSILMSFAHRWLKERAIHKVLLHGRLDIQEFYESWGYKPMPFDDPDALPGERIDMGRYLG